MVNPRIAKITILAIDKNEFTVDIKLTDSTKIKSVILTFSQFSDINCKHRPKIVHDQEAILLNKFEDLDISHWTRKK